MLTWIHPKVLQDWPRSVRFLQARLCVLEPVWFPNSFHNVRNISRFSAIHFFLQVLFPWLPSPNLPLSPTGPTALMLLCCIRHFASYLLISAAWPWNWLRHFNSINNNKCLFCCRNPSLYIHRGMKPPRCVFFFAPSQNKWPLSMVTVRPWWRRCRPVWGASGTLTRVHQQAEQIWVQVTKRIRFRSKQEDLSLQAEQIWALTVKTHAPSLKREIPS